jgi:hypothetical protein
LIREGSLKYWYRTSSEPVILIPIERCIIIKEAMSKILLAAKEFFCISKTGIGNAEYFNYSQEELS